MATTAKKKSPAKKSVKKKPALKQSKKVNPYLIGIGAIVVAIVGALIVRMSFASTWPNVVLANYCNATTLNQRSWGLVLAEGSRGGCVKVFQDGLKKAGFLAPGASVDGIFGPKTANSVLVLESYYGLKNPDKIVDQCTWVALRGSIYYGKTTSGVSRVKQHVAQYAGKSCLR
jgi:hypothetical protein